MFHRKSHRRKKGYCDWSYSVLQGRAVWLQPGLYSSQRLKDKAPVVKLDILLNQNIFPKVHQDQTRLRWPCIFLHWKKSRILYKKIFQPVVLYTLQGIPLSCGYFSAPYIKDKPQEKRLNNWLPSFLALDLILKQRNGDTQELSYFLPSQFFPLPIPTDPFEEYYFWTEFNF